MTLHRNLTCLLALALTAATAQANPVVYTIGDSGQFGTVDLSTGSFSPIGPGIPVGTGGLVQGPAGNLLSLGFDGTLYSINPNTGTLSTVGATGLGNCATPASACGSNAANIIGSVGANLYATDFANHLYSVNPVTGIATLIGSTGIPSLPFTPHFSVPGDPDGSFYIFDETLFSHDGVLYANFDAGIFDPVTFTPTSLVNPLLYQINTTTGLASVLSAVDFGLAGLTDVNGTVYGFSLPTASVVTLDLATGSATYVSDADPAAGMVGGATAVAPTPELSSLTLAGTGLTMLAACLRRKLGA